MLKVCLTVIANSDKHTGYCVAAMDDRGKFYRLVRDKEGHALLGEQCRFQKLDRIFVDITPAPLKHQRENYVLNKLLEVRRSALSADEFATLFRSRSHIFENEKPWLTEEEMRGQRHAFQLAKVSNLHIYANDEGKHKADFICQEVAHTEFSLTDPAFKTKEHRIKKAALLFSLPDAAFMRYGNELHYKFICAVYPLKATEKRLKLHCYCVGGQSHATLYDGLHEEKCA